MLVLIKIAHTIVWALFVACIGAIFVSARAERFGVALALIGIVLVEVVVLLWNRMSCPLTGVAARYTEERAANFDIYLPLWLAKHNKSIFGALYVAGIGYTLAEWLR